MALGAAVQQRILGGVRILDLTRFLSGPQATLFLAGLGAEVIRIDEPGDGGAAAKAPPFFGPNGVSFQRQTPNDLGIAYLKRCRAKKAITLNLKSAEGLDLFYRLVQTADVLVENFRVGVTERLGISYATLQQKNPRLIHCAITGYGSTGPDASLKAFDPMVQAASGLMSITGDPDGPAFKAGSPLSDGIAGTFAMASVLGAILQRERTGQGQFIDVSMTDCLVSLIFDEPLDCYERLDLPFRQGNRIMRFAPFNTYPATDGMIVIGAATQSDWEALLEVIGRVDLLASEKFMEVGWRLANCDLVDEFVAAWTRKLSILEIVSALNAREIACSPIREAKDVASWPHLVARGTFSELVHPEFPDLTGVLAPEFPVKFSNANTDYARPAAFIGAHNDEVYSGLLGLSLDECDRLKRQGVI
jgi:CoA:oxalate CoA-transferase